MQMYCTSTGLSLNERVECAIGTKTENKNTEMSVAVGSLVSGLVMISANGVEVLREDDGISKGKKSITYNNFFLH